LLPFKTRESAKRIFRDEPERLAATIPVARSIITRKNRDTRDTREMTHQVAGVTELMYKTPEIATAMTQANLHQSIARDTRREDPPFLNSLPAGLDACCAKLKNAKSRRDTAKTATVDK
jgi:hypothetical protein